MSDAEIGGGDFITGKIHESAQGVVIGTDIVQSFYRINATLIPKVRDLKEAIDALSIDDETREILINQLQDYEKLAQASAAGELQRQQDEFNLKLAQQKASFEQEQAIRQSELRLREAETKTKRIIRLLDKDLVSVIIGGVLLLTLSISLIVMMVRGVVDSRLLENAFFILLGYFFGQGIAARSTSIVDPVVKDHETLKIR